MQYFGYIDPSVATYLIQAGAGIIIAVGAFLGAYFKKHRKKQSQKKTSETESDEIVRKRRHK